MSSLSAGFARCGIHTNGHRFNLDEQPGKEAWDEMASWTESGQRHALPRRGKDEVQ
jgi:hypothetical protein